mgnify:CR=1 FL=1
MSEVKSGRGSIPASAGAPGIASPGATSVGVYPRVCGGTRTKDLVREVGKGLSPRLRGHHQIVANISNWSGSIPASAGAPIMCNSGYVSPRVYPRVCGGTNVQGVTERITAGLSPRLRGHRGQRRGSGRVLGSIPASAGAPHTVRCRGRHTGVYPRVCGGTRAPRRHSPPR